MRALGLPYVRPNLVKDTFGQGGKRTSFVWKYLRNTIGRMQLLFSQLVRILWNVQKSVSKSQSPLNLNENACVSKRNER